MDDYLTECRALGLEIVEISSGFLAIPDDDLVRLTEAVVRHKLKAKPEINVQFGAGGTSSVEQLTGPRKSQRRMHRLRVA